MSWLSSAARLRDAFRDKRGIMKREDVLEVILRTRVVAVIRMSDGAKVFQAVEAIRKGGVKAIEITMTVPNALHVIRDMAAKKPSDICLGAGTVLDAETATAVIHAGADFVVSPISDAGMIQVCRVRDMFVVPGAFTPTEIVAAWEKGADIVKVFPATSVGLKYFQDLRGPLPHIRLMPTGGVSLTNAKDFLDAGACCIGIGTALLDQRAIERNDWDALSERARSLIESLAPMKS
jgi:2-dehydro-3-deoxyphosphogluconate aldolase/(4S)-4-hydroxy-2-oxoglutarate aldolase